MKSFLIGRVVQSNWSAKRCRCWPRLVPIAQCLEQLMTDSSNCRMSNDSRGWDALRSTSSSNVERFRSRWRWAREARCGRTQQSRRGSPSAWQRQPHDSTMRVRKAARVGDFWDTA